LRLSHRQSPVASESSMRLFAVTGDFGGRPETPSRSRPTHQA
jgi:hypothetical protein